MKKVLVTGVTGMVGGLIFQECLSSTEVSQIVSLVRKPTGFNHPKLQELVVDDFEDYAEIQEYLRDVSVAFFCIGVYTGQVSDDEFKTITVNYPVSLARTLKTVSPGVTYCLLSGAGADTKEKSRMSFAKYKGMAENQISAEGLKAFYTFRPGYIFPVKPRKEPNFTYKVSRSLYPLIRLLGKNASIKSTELAKVMFEVGMHGADQNVLENGDMLDIVAKS